MQNELAGVLFPWETGRNHHSKSPADNVVFHLQDLCFAFWTILVYTQKHANNISKIDNK